MSTNVESQRLSNTITAICATLTAFGVVMIYSASSVAFDLRNGDSTSYLRKQAVWVGLAAIIFALARTTSVSWLEKRAKPILGFSLFLLLLVLIPGLGTKVGGARRWIRLAGLNGEPSELAKLAIVVFAAAWGARGTEIFSDFRKGFLPAFGAVAATAGLIVLEPDMGTASFCAAIGLTVLVVAGMRLRHLAAVGAPGVAALGLFAVFKLQYIAQRVAAWRDLDADASGTGYQIRQAVIALGSGGPLGLGLGESRQKRLFLPDGHTDFIFALVGEELGFVGTIALVVLYATLVVLAIRAIQRAKDRFSFLLGTGLAFALGLQAALNMAVATASIPPKGIALPFVSFGGSPLLFCAAAAGVLARIAAEGQPPTPTLPPLRGGRESIEADITEEAVS
ncbi:MAG TPA: putative peptidoglycan glycosyltransferase FtsW [Planctomycetota bacterium]|nr:putative peptidoglycan glycosyltransferase FtsW [Planctomycetota bacterium]